MKIINVAMSTLLVTSLFAGCVSQPGDEPADEDTADQTSDSDTSLPDASEDAELRANAIDARALAGQVRVLDGSETGPVALASWFSGPVAPGATLHYVWNNAPATYAYQAGASPIGASLTSPCTFEITRQWDLQKYSGEREFHWYVKNIGSITCGADVLLEGMARSYTWDTLGLNAGASKSWTWNNANPLNASYFVGLNPSGATSTENCELEVTRTYYVQQPSGEREFKLTVKNVGDIACQGDVNLALTTAADSSWSTQSMAAGTSKGWTWNNANPLTRIYQPGLSPAGAYGSNPCSLEVTRQYYRQRINTNGNAEREFVLYVDNVGGITCSGTVLLNHML